jgi:hypothetical protein
MEGDLAFGVFIFLVGLKVFYSGYLRHRSFLRAQEWPTADGMIESSQLLKNENGVWIPEIWYSYWVDGTEFQSSIVNADSEMNVGFTDKFAREKVDRYPSGASVLVHYSPDDHQMAFLETKASSGSKIWLGAGSLLMVAGLLVAGIPFLK